MASSRGSSHKTGSTPQTPQPSESSHARSLPSQAGANSEIDFSTIKHKYERVKHLIQPSSDKKTFMVYFLQLETAILKGKLASYNDAQGAIKRLEPILCRRKVDPSINDFFTMIKKLKDALDKGYEVGRPFMHIKSDNSQEASPINETYKVEENAVNRRMEDSKSPMVVADKSADDKQKRDQPSNFTSHIENMQLKAAASDIKQDLLWRTSNTVVNQWLSALKSDIERGQFTASFVADTSIALTTTKELLQDIAKSLKANAEREHKLREDYKTLKSQQQDSEHKILSIWSLFGSKKKASPQPNYLDALSEFGRFITESKQSSDTFRFIEENANQEISLLKQDIENLQDEKCSPVIHETETDPALVKSLKQLRKELLLKKKKIAEARSTVSQKNASETQRMHEMASDELRSNVTDVCAFCATDGKLNPALYFCKDCSKFGRYICGICNKNHGRFTNNHNVERISTT